MKFSLRLAFLVVLFITSFGNWVFSQNLGFDWIKVHESLATSGLNVSIVDMQIDNNNNLIVTGYFQYSAKFDSDTLHSIDSKDIFLIKYNSVGEILWLKHFGGNNDDRSLSITINSSNDIYLSGWFKDDCTFDSFSLTTSSYREQFLMKINESGVTQWVKSIASDSFYNKITIDDTGNIYHSGWIHDYISFDSDTLWAGSHYDIYIAKLDQAGNFINGIVINGRGYQIPEEIKYHEGNLYIIGHFEYDIWFPGNTLSTTDKKDIFIAKYNSDLEFQWTKQIGGYYDDFAEDIIFRENDFIISGSFTHNCYFSENEYLTSNGVLDGFLASYDFLGNFNWGNSIGGPSNEYNSRVISDDSGLLYFTGTSRGTIKKEGYSYESYEFTGDIYMARFSPDGDFHWLTGFNGIGYEYTRAFRKNMNSEFVLIGSFEDGVYFNDTIAQGTSGSNDNIFATVFNDTIQQNDIEVSYMSEPEQLILFESDKQITVKVTNLGANPQSNISISYSVNGNTPVVNTISALEPFETTYHTFSQTVDMTEIGDYAFEFEVELVGDENPENNTLIDTVVSIAVPTNSLHWGSTGDPLNGLTVSWTNVHDYDNNIIDSIKWGYTDEYAEGTFVPELNNLSDKDLNSYQFPSLIEDTVIHYSVYNNYWNEWSADKTYNTSPGIDSDVFSFSVTGNNQANTWDWKKVADTMNDDYAFGLFLGNIASSSYNWGDVWEEWMVQGENLTANNLLYHVFGDYDYDSGLKRYENILILPESPSVNKRYYSFEYGNALFICLDSRDNYNEQNAWLESTLEENSDKMWKFVYFNRLFYSCGGHESELDFLFDSWWQTFDDHGVDMILNSQAANYQRTKPINRNLDTEKPVGEYGSKPHQGRCQINLGGAGAVLEEVVLNDWFETAEAVLHFGKFEINDNRLIFSAVDTSGQLIDSFVHVKYFPGEVIASDDSICIGSSTGNMSLVNYKGNIIKWQKRNNSGDWTDIDNSIETYEEIPISNGLWEYRAELIDFDSTIYSIPFQIYVLDNPVSGFSYISNNLEASFMNLSENADSYFWDFGDGNFSSEGSPFHVYSSPNMYNVQLVAIDNICSDTFASSVIVHLPGEVISNKDSICVGSSTGNISLINYKGTITKWQKRFNGGDWTDIDNVVATYEEIPESAGFWDYRTELIDYDSILYSVPVQIYVLEKPVSNFSYVSNNLVTKFRNLSDNANSYLWDFGDGEISTEESPFHNYSFPNTYNVKLTAMNKICSVTFALNIILYLPGETISDKDTICIGSSTGNMSLVNYKGAITKWQKRFNNGDWTEIENSVETYEEIPEIAGLWEYRTELVDFDSTLYSIPVQIYVLDKPVADFSYVSYNLEARFMNLSENADSYLWGFGEGSFSTQESPVHAYSTSGMHNVQLIATNNFCLNDTFTSNVKLYLPEISSDEDSVCLGSSIGNLSLNNYKGTIVKWQKRINGTNWMDIVNTVETYDEIPENAGLWEYRTELIDFDSTIYSMPIQIYVIEKPISDFSYVSYNLEARFINVSENSEFYLWDFGDGNFSSQESPVHFYSSSNEYIVRLIGINNICKDTVVSNVKIHLPKTISNNDTIYLGTSTGNISLIDYGGTIIKWQKRLNESDWTDIDNIADYYEEIPENAGLFEYRTELIEFDSTLYSIPVQIHVLEEAVSNVLMPENGSEIVSVYPNPTSGIIYISLNEIQDDMIVRVYDLTGKKIIEKFYTRFDKTSLSLEKLVKGNYILQLSSDNILVNRFIFLK